jgi:hypothetical protein
MDYHTHWRQSPVGATAREHIMAYTPPNDTSPCERLVTHHRDVLDALDAAISAATCEPAKSPGEAFCDELAQALRYHASPRLADLGRRIEAIDHEGCPT